jgi:transcription elongation GreA/GreB family factor
MANKTEIRIEADEARRLKSDAAFQQFMQSVRDNQMQIFASSGAADIAAREEAHAILRALTLIEMRLDAATTAEAFLDRKQRK